MNNSPINDAPFAVTGYRCTVCKRFHRKGSKLFLEHYNESAKEHGFKPLPQQEQAK